MSEQLVVVIAGATCGGKSTIANNLSNIFDNISILHQDDFYHTDYKYLESIPELNYHEWDKINAFNMDSMVDSIKSQSSKFLILEGILLLEDDRISELADLTFFLTMDKNDCWERRKLKSYLPPEPDGYFDKYAWPEYQKHLARVKKEKHNVIFLNGTDSIDFNMNIVVNRMKQLIL